MGQQTKKHPSWNRTYPRRRKHNNRNLNPARNRKAKTPKQKIDDTDHRKPYTQDKLPTTIKPPITRSQNHERKIPEKIYNHT